MADRHQNAPARPRMLRRVLDAVVESRMRHVELEISRMRKAGLIRDVD